MKCHISFPRSYFSQHARMRILERFEIAPDALLGLLNQGLGKHIGTSSRETRRVHRMLWSPADEAILVAIQNISDGYVITVLTLDMYLRDYAENVTPKTVQRVINRMVYAGHAPDHLWVKVDSKDSPWIYVEVGTTKRTVMIGPWTDPMTVPRPHELGRCKKFWNWVAKRAIKKKIPLDDVAYAVGHYQGRIVLPSPISQ